MQQIGTPARGCPVLSPAGRLHVAGIKAFSVSFVRDLGTVERRVRVGFFVTVFLNPWL